MAQSKDSLRLIVNDSILLKILTPLDISKKYPDWLNNPEINKYMEVRFDAHTYLTCKVYLTKMFKDPTEFLFGIFYRNEHIGNVKLGSINRYHAIGEVSFFLGEKICHNKGIGRMCVQEVCQFGFETLGLRKINSSYYAENLPSARLLSRIGFKVEGVRRENTLHDGRPMDLIQVGILKTELVKSVSP